MYYADTHYRLVVNSRQRYASLKTTKKIKAHDEIFTDYNTEYVYSRVTAIHLTGVFRHSP